MDCFVGVAGNIGAGKTTLCGLLASHFEWDAHFESVVDNPYLEDFYSDKSRWGFHLQVYFLQHRFRSCQQLAQRKRGAIQDRTIWEDARIFAHNLFKLGHINERDWATYQSLFAGIEASLPRPQLLIYLRASLDTLLTRIQKRGREYEAAMDPEYLLHLNLAYDKWISGIHEFPVLILEADSLDFVANPNCIQDVIKKVDARLGTRQLGLGLENS